MLIKLKTHYKDPKLHKDEEFICASEPDFVPGFVIVNVTEDKRIALEAAIFDSLTWKFINETDPEFEALNHERKLRKSL